MVVCWCCQTFPGGHASCRWLWCMGQPQLPSTQWDCRGSGMWLWSPHSFCYSAGELYIHTERCRRIPCEQIRSRTNQQLIAERFGLGTKFLYVADAFMTKMSCNYLLIDSATYLLTVNLPTLKSVAMSLYDIILRDNNSNVYIANLL